MAADVKFGAKYFTADYDFIFQEIDVSPPAVSKKLIPIPGTSSNLDLTESLSGDVEYDNREVAVDGQAVDGVRRWAHNYSAFANDVHGQLLKIVATNDPSFYWYGRVEVKKFSDKPTGADIEVTADVDPYKYEVTSSLEDWLWADLSIDTIIRDYKDIVVNTTATLVIIGRRKKICPIFNCTELMTVTYLTNVYNLPIGLSQVPDIFLDEGNHTLLFTSTVSALVSVDYRGAML